jgi:hypothetical protein
MENIREIAVQTDTQLAELYWKAFKAKAELNDYAQVIHRISGSEYKKGYRYERIYIRPIEEAIESGAEKSWEQNSFELNVAKFNSIKAELGKHTIVINELEKIYKKYLWNRAFYVPAGHVHKSRDCSTCYDSTEFTWLPKYSGGSEDDIVNDAGEEACTVCYPSAPAEVLNRPSVIVTADKIAKAEAKAERDIAKAQREAKRIASSPTCDGEPLIISNGERKTRYDRESGNFIKLESFQREELKTERTAKIWYVDQLSNFRNKPDERVEIIRESCELIVSALAEKHGVDPEVVRNELNKKVEARIKKSEKERKAWEERQARSQVFGQN